MTWLLLVPTAEWIYTSKAPLLIFHWLDCHEFYHFHQRFQGSYTDHIYALMHQKSLGFERSFGLNVFPEKKIRFPCCLLPCHIFSNLFILIQILVAQTLNYLSPLKHEWCCKFKWVIYWTQWWQHSSSGERLLFHVYLKSQFVIFNVPKYTQRSFIIRDCF